MVAVKVMLGQEKCLPYAFVDLDGTLLDSMKRHYKVLLDALSCYSLEVKTTYLDFYKLKREGYSTKDICRLSGYDSNEIEIISWYWRRHIEDIEFLNCDKLFPDALPFLKDISTQFTVIVLTARNNDYVVTQLNNTDVSLYVSDIKLVSPQNAFEQKKEFVSNTGVNNSICIGDTENEYRIHEELGIDTYILNRGFRSVGFWERKGIRSYDNLVDVINCIKKRYFK